MTESYRCGVCGGPVRWTVERRGDAVVTWSCDPHLAEVCRDLQRQWEVTELVVVDTVKRVERGEDERKAAMDR